ncbi:MAG TPA: hypothetical protein VIN09_03705, partial [Chloroflexota bacterium]
ASATGLEATNTVEGTLTSESPGGDSTSVTHTANVSIVNEGNASANSDDACAGAACGDSTAEGTTSGVEGQSVTQASSGDARAQGLEAENNVETTANVAVRIGGDNFGAIRVVVQSITSIVNWGRAQVESGLAAAVGGLADVASSSAGPTSNGASSGDAQATGAVVTNNVELGSRVSMRIEGDNHNPIQVMVRLVVNLFNRGNAEATSGNAWSGGAGASSGAQETTAGGASSNAQSGAASATGLRAQNNVDLWSDVFIDITGSNYAPIDIFVLFDTSIENQGTARATSGDAYATQAASEPSLASSAAGQGGATPTAESQSGAASVAGSTTTDSSTTETVSSVASTFTASSDGLAMSFESAIHNQGTARSTSSDVQSSASDVTSSGASSSGSSSTAGPSSNWSGSLAVSGSGEAMSVESVLNADNLQIAAVSAPGARRAVASNSASYDVDVRGSATVKGGDAIAGPMPTPGPEPSGSGSPPPGPAGSGQQGGGRSFQVSKVRGTVVDVELWPAMPVPDAPPMPDLVLRQRVEQSTRSVVAGAQRVSLELWGIDLELEAPPMPDLVIGPRQPLVEGPSTAVRLEPVPFLWTVVPGWLLIATGISLVTGLAVIWTNRARAVWYCRTGLLYCRTVLLAIVRYSLAVLGLN